MGSGVWVTCDWCGQKYELCYQQGFTAKDPGWGGKTYRCCGAKCKAEAEASFRAKKEAKEAKKAAKKAERESEEYESGGGSSSSSSGSGGMGVVGNVIGGVVLILLLIIVIGVIFSKSEDANDPAVKMAKWEEHLEKRRAAFAEGLSEEGVEARGLRNYTWEEWQKRDQNQNKKPIEKKTKSLSDVFSEYHDYRRDLVRKGYSEQQAADMGFVNDGFSEFSARFKDKDAEEELKKLKQRAEELMSTRSDEVQPSGSVTPKGEEKRPAVQPAVVDPRGEKPKQVVKPNVDKPKPSTQPNTAQPVVGERKPVAPSAVSGQPNNTGNKASKDSAGIAITVKGKGKTKDAAVRWAIREAVWKTVGKWVDSKERIQANRDKVAELVKTITESDVRKYEILESHEEDGNIVLKVKVYVSKKMIAPKFANLFPDVFRNDND